MAARSTSFRLSDTARQALTTKADAAGITATALLELMILEGVATLDHPGVTHRGPVTDRRAGLAGGPDVWEVVARLRELEGSEEARVTALAEESGLHPRQIRIALDFAAAHHDDVRARIARNEQAIEDGQAAAHRRQTLLA